MRSAISAQARRLFAMSRKPIWACSVTLPSAAALRLNSASLATPYSLRNGQVPTWLVFASALPLAISAAASGRSGSGNSVLRSIMAHLAWRGFADRIQASCQSPNLWSRPAMANKIYNPATVAPPVGSYSHAIETPPNARWLTISGQVGVSPDGKVGASAAEQAEQIWKNILAILADAGMGPEDLVKVTTFLTRKED